jgi:hypothetical protein
VFLIAKAMPFLQTAGASLSEQTVKPNEEWALAPAEFASGRSLMTATLVRSSPFVPPFW